MECSIWNSENQGKIYFNLELRKSGKNKIWGCASNIVVFRLDG